MSTKDLKNGFYPEAADEISEIVRTHRRVQPIGCGTKSGLSHLPEDCICMRLEKLSGIVEYAPEEFTITVKSGTSVALIQTELETNGQSLPFDPPLVESGATIGGVVASGLSGPGSQRYGGIRDFILGVRFVDGRGIQIRGGGKVVKNSAGFDLPKLMVGSIGRLGILTEVTFKVFPNPEDFQTLRFEFQSIDHAKDAIILLISQSLDLAGLELESDATLYVRIGGLKTSFAARISRIQSLLRITGEVFSGRSEGLLWQNFREFKNTENYPTLLKMPISPPRISEIENLLNNRSAMRRYGAGGRVAWVGLPNSESVVAFGEDLKTLGFSALVFLGENVSPLIGAYPGRFFLNRIKSAIDPDDRFLPFL